MKVVEINDNDIYGKVFNGYDIAENLNKEEDFNVTQIVINKFSDAKFVKPLFKNRIGLDYEHILFKLSNDILSVHSLLSITTDYLENNSVYQAADLAHYHQFHNTHLNLIKLKEMALKKPTILSFHDPWFITGRCVHPDNCLKFETGCEKCPNLNNLFLFSIDYCNELWKIKKDVLESSDIDIIVPSKFMMDLLKKNPYTKNLNIHFLPFGIDVTKYEFAISKEDAKIKLGINPRNIVLFFREAEEKGTKYIVEALSKLNVDVDITLLTCSQVGLLDDISDKYQIIELGNIDEKKMLECYNASDIFLMPSLGESFGMMAIEAMAASLPVVIFDNTALPSVTFAPEVGVLVRNKDSEDLKEKIAYLIENEDERVKRGNLGKDIVQKNYNIHIYENKLKEIYKEAYNRQKYKLNNKINISYTINYDNIEVQKALIKFLELYKSYLPQEEIPKIFKKIKDANIDTSFIKYSDKNVQNLIVNFNNILYEKVKEKENKHKDKFELRNTYIYKLLKKSKILRRMVHYFRRPNKYQILQDKYQILQDKYQILQDKYDNLLNDVNLIKEKNKIIEDNLSETNKQFQIISKNFADFNNDVKQDINLMEQNMNRIEKSLYDVYKCLESKLWQFNSDLNIVLYEQSFKDLHKKKHFYPLISLIIPAYNAKNYLREAIDSALAQTYNNIEIIVVNDGSNDDGATRKIAKSYGNKIKYFEKENGGVSSALNCGIKNMNGDYFAWLSHDDLIDINHIEKLVEFMSYEENDNKIPFVNFKIIDENGKIDLNQTIIAQLNCSDYKMSVTHNLYSLLQGEINGGSVLIPKEAFRKYGMFDESLRITQERDMWSRLMKGYEFVNIPYDTASIRMHKNQVTNTASEVVEKTDEKKFQIISGISKDEILKLESNIDMFYEKIINFYSINNKKDLAEEIRKLEEGVKNEK